MRKTVKADTKQFHCRIQFNIQCTKEQLDAVVEHYESVCLFYNIKGLFYLDCLSEADELCEIYSFSLTLQKAKQGWHLSTVALRNVMLNDLEIIRQLHYISDPLFVCL